MPSNDLLSSASAESGPVAPALGLDELLRRVAKPEDHAAWEELVIRQWPVVKAVVHSVLGHRDGCEDAVQETFIRIHRYAAGYVGTGPEVDRSAQAWVAQVARRSALTWLSRSQKKTRVIDEDSTVFSVPPKELEDSAVDADSVRAAVAELPDAERQSVEMRFQQGRSYTTIGTMLGISDVAARKRVARGLDLLRRRLGGLALSVLVLALVRPSLWAAATGIAAAGTGSAAAQTAKVAGSAAGGKVGLGFAFGAVIASVLGVVGWRFLAPAGLPPSTAPTPVITPLHPLAHTYATTFPATEDPISEHGRWINGGTVGRDWTNIRTRPGFAFGSGSGNPAHDDSTAVLAGIWGPDQSAQATVRLATMSTVNRDGSLYMAVELRLRSTLTAHRSTGYEFNFPCAFHGSQALGIVRWNEKPRDFTDLAVFPCLGVKDGDVVRATIVGNRLSAYINGVLVAQATDNTYPTGSPGIGLSLVGPASANDDFGFTDFSATDGVAAASAR